VRRTGFASRALAIEVAKFGDMTVKFPNKKNKVAAV
jgi:hypothetical protein